MKCVQIKNFSSDVYEVYKQVKDIEREICTNKKFL